MLRAVSSEAKSKGIRVEAGLDGIKLKTRLPAEKSLSRNEVDGITCRALGLVLCVVRTRNRW